MIKIVHGIYSDRIPNMRRRCYFWSYSFPVYRKTSNQCKLCKSNDIGFFFSDKKCRNCGSENIIEIHNIMKYLPIKFRKLIIEKYHKFFSVLRKKGKKGIPLEFTFGYDEETRVMAIAIVHPGFDDFNRSNGYDSVKGRIERVNKRGSLYCVYKIEKDGVQRQQFHDNGIPKTFIPRYIYVDYGSLYDKEV